MQLHFNETLTQKVTAFAKEKGIDASKIIQMALEEFFDDWEAEARAEKIWRDNSRVWTMEEVKQGRDLLDS
jgi:hypothetical protein